MNTSWGKKMKISVDLFSGSAGLAGLILGSTLCLPAIALPSPSITRFTPLTPFVSPLLTGVAPTLLAQASPAYNPTGCRLTREAVGVYEEPNTTQTARGFLKPETAVTLGDGSGEGWARIVSPLTGWVQSKFLKLAKPTDCGTVVSGPGVTPGTAPATTVPTPPPPPSTQTAKQAVCTVIPEAGLVVRDMPNPENSRVIGSIRPGRYTFQFTERRLALESPEGLRQWIYITAPAKGWISPGFVNGGSNLSGENCN